MAQKKGAGAEKNQMKSWIPYIVFLGYQHLDVSKNRGTPKWMVNIMENPNEQMDDLGGKPIIFGNTHLGSC